jgi:hypothetical protein
MAQYPIKEPSSYSPPWEPKISSRMKSRFVHRLKHSPTELLPNPTRRPTIHGDVLTVSGPRHRWSAPPAKAPGLLKK